MNVLERLKADLDKSVDEMCRVACGPIAARGGGIYRIEKDMVINGCMMELMEERGYLVRVQRKGSLRYYELSEKGRQVAMEDPVIRTEMMQWGMP